MYRERSHEQALNREQVNAHAINNKKKYINGHEQTMNRKLGHHERAINTGC